MSVFVTKALNSIWCSPEMDYQRIYCPGRLTSAGGMLRSMTVLFSHVFMPTVSDRYHVFQLGNRTTVEMGISKTIGGDWVNLVDIINEEQMLFDVYTDVGKLVHAKDVFISRLDRTNIIIAIKDSNRLPDIRTEAIYLRTYSNAWAASTANNHPGTRTFMDSRVIKTVADAADLTNLYQDYSRNAGRVRLTIDGVIRDLPPMGSIEIGSSVDMFHEVSINWNLIIPVNTLKIFESTLDNTEKYIIHPSKDLFNTRQIHYHDDIDFYVVTGNGVNRRGLLLHSNVKESQRMLTHSDYAIRVSHVRSLADKLGVPTEMCAIQMVIRHGGAERELSLERHFIHELYKLDDETIIDILAEETASIQYWTAVCLENSYYTQLMRSGLSLVEEDHCLKAFGYGGCTTAVMQSPIKLSASSAVERPLGFQGEVLATLNDRTTGKSQMLYIPASRTVNGQIYANNVIDFRLGALRHRRKVYHQIAAFDLPTDMSFTAYRAVKENGVATGAWEDVTRTTDYAYENGRFKWLIELPLYEVMVVPGDYTNLVTKVVPYLAETEIDLREGFSVRDRYIPTAEIRVIADGMLLTYGVDYYVSGGMLHVTNLEACSGTDTLVQIAQIGCSSDRPKTEHGFVYGDTLSNDGFYDLHDGSVKSVTSGGSLIAHTEQSFFEAGTTNTALKNGAPYEIIYYRGPIAGVAWWKVSDLRDDWDETFGALEDFLTSRLTSKGNDTIESIEDVHELFSPFMHRIINDLAAGTLSLGEGPFLDDSIRRIAEGYTDLLRYEPLLRDTYDDRFIYVAPMANVNMVDLTLDERYVIERINELYLDGKLNFTSYIGVSND